LLDGKTREPLEKFVAEVVILLAFAPKAFAVKRQGSRGPLRPRAKVAAVRGEQPRPAQHVPRACRLYSGQAAMRDHDIHGHLTFANEVKLIGRVALAEDNLTFLEAHVAGASGDELDVPLFQGLEERVCPD
jgi:hypothetical protein